MAANNNLWKWSNINWYWKILWQWNKWWFEKNLMGVYSSDSITKHINFCDIIKEKRAKYPFAIFNTDRENKPGTHWWSFLDIHLQFSTLIENINQGWVGGAFLIFIKKKDLLLFDSFVFVAFKQFIIDNDSAIIDKMLFNLKKNANNHINLVSLTFSIETNKKI